MNIYIDESGNFLPSSNATAVSTVCALLVPEKCRKRLESLLVEMRRHSPRGLVKRELKANELSESALQNFLRHLSGLDVVAVGVVADMSNVTELEISDHKEAQAKKIDESALRVNSDAGKESIREIATTIRRIPNQLYVQLVSQITLVARVLHNGTLYYAQHAPVTLREFRWRVDQKNANPTAYEKTFRDIAPIILQTISFREPLVEVTDPEFDYSHMSPYMRTADEFPNHLTNDAGRKPVETFDTSKIFWSNFQFVDSESVVGIQAVDLLATCTRRCLQGKFDNPQEIARGLGSVFHSHPLREHCLELITLGREAEVRSPDVVRALNNIASHSRPIVDWT